MMMDPFHHYHPTNTKYENEQCFELGSACSFLTGGGFNSAAGRALANLGVILPHLIGQLCWVDLFSTIYSYSFCVFSEN